MEKYLSGKKLLFISTKYFGYDKEILNSLKQTGAEIQFYYDDPLDYIRIVDSRIVQLILNDKIKQSAYNKLRSRILQKTSNKSFDFVFVLKGSLLNISFLQALRASQPKAAFIQYQWDSIKNFNYTAFLPFFDLSFSFDISDAKNVPAIHHLPMFARDDFFDLIKQRPSVKQDYDVLFVGSNHSNRLLILRKLKAALNRQNFKLKSFVYLPFFVGLKGVFLSRKLKFSELMFGAVSKNKLKHLLLQTKYVLDLPSPEQTGTTPRALEALAAGCGLITTNPFIQQEPFYNEEFIKIIDLDTDLSKNISSILQSPLQEPIQVNVEAYALSNWVKTIVQMALSIKH